MIDQSIKHIHISIFGPLNSLGMGIHTYNLAKAYEKLIGGSYSGLTPEVSVYPPFGRDQINDVYTKRWLANRVFSDTKTQPSLMIFDLQFMVHFSGRPRIGFAVFETNGFTELQLAGLKSLDHILTPSVWGQKVLEKYNLKSFVVPEGFDPEVFPMVTERTANWTERNWEKPFRFLHVGKFEERKGTEQVIRAFSAEFDTEEAELILHSENPFLDGKGNFEVTGLLRASGFNPIRWSTFPCVWERKSLRVVWDAPRSDMSALYSEADCGIFPSKGEGWGLPIMECLVSGIPVIVGRWSAMTEYIKPDYPQELQLWHSQIESANDGIWFYGDRGDWYVSPDDEVRKAMRWAYANARTLRNQDAWLRTVSGIREFTWARSAIRLQEVLKSLV